jgi:uridine monophosphate synthetase
MNSKEKICLDLFEIGAIKFGEFTLKSGLKSPIYIDLRVLVSYPKALKETAAELKKISKKLKFDRIAGIPYAAIAIATALSLKTGWPMIYPRKEVKDYGTKKPIEGTFKEGETVLVVDDLITTGGSKFEAILPLQENGLKVKDIVVLVDREQGGAKELAEKGYALHAVLKISEILQILKENKKISEEQFNDISNYFANPEEWSKTRSG